MVSVFTWKRVIVLAVLVIGALLLALPAFAGTSYIYSSTSYAVDGNTRVKVCDSFRNARNANATFTRRNGKEGIVVDTNGAGGGCSRPSAGGVGIKFHTTHEGNADGNTSRH